VIGFGAMRMHGRDVKPWAEIVAQATEAGFNYFETSQKYCNSTSETKVGEGLKDYRGRVYISTKCAARDVPTADGAREAIDESLRKLGTGYVDFYQLWDCKLNEFETIAAKKGGTLEGIRRAMRDGLVRHLGITTHDTPENMIRLLETGEFEAVTVQYNLVNRTAEPVMEWAADHGLGVVVMGPLHGGILAAKSPFLDGLVKMGAGETPAEVAFRFVLSNPNVTCAISGMAKASDVEEDKRIAERMRPLTAVEREALDEGMREFAAGAGKVCTLCEYCMPCPQDIWIPGIMTLSSAARLLGLEDEARRQYAEYVKNWANGEPPCVQCERCVEKCPQGIDIPAEIKKTHERFK